MKKYEDNKVINFNIDYLTSISNEDLLDIVRFESNLGKETLSLINEFTTDTNILCHIAAHSKTSFETLMSLSSLNNDYINYYLVSNFNTPICVLMLLAESDNKLVKHIASRNLAYINFNKKMK